MDLGFVSLEYHVLQTEVDLSRLLTGSLMKIFTVASSGRSLNVVVRSTLLEGAPSFAIFVY